MLYMPLNSYIQEQTESNFAEFANQNRRFCKPISPKLLSNFAQITFQFRPFCNVVEGFDVERLALSV